MKVSIVTPSYQQGRFIERTLQSVAKQTHCEIEHVVFDGGSTDTTIEVLKQFNPPVHWVSKRDGGQASAVNAGILTTQGDIVGWLNSDDIYYPGTVKHVVEYLSANPEVDVVYGMADHIDIYDNAFESYPTEDWNFERLIERCFICQPALFFRRCIIEKHGLLNERLNYCMDYEYWLRLGKAGVQFGYLEEKLAGSRLYDDTKTLGARVEVHKEINDMFKDLFGRVPDRWLFNYAHAVVEKHPLSKKMSHNWLNMQLAIRSLMAAVVWNKSVSSSMWKSIFSWIQFCNKE